MSKEFQWVIRGNILYRSVVGSIDLKDGFLSIPVEVFKHCYSHIETIQIYDTENKVYYTSPKETFSSFMDEKDDDYGDYGWFAIPIEKLVSSATPKQVIKDTDLFKASDYMEVK